MCGASATPPLDAVRGGDRPRASWAMARGPKEIAVGFLVYIQKKNQYTVLGLIFTGRTEANMPSRPAQLQAGPAERRVA